MQSSLPVIDRPLDNTAWSAYAACPREYMLSMIRHLRSTERKAALEYGTLWHKAMEVHYKSDGNRDLVQAAIQIYAGNRPDAPPDEHRTWQRSLLEYDKYVKRYGSPKNEAASGQGRTVGWPDAPLVELSTNLMGAGLIHPWAGKIDRLTEIGGLYYIDDHKTTSRFTKDYFRQYVLSNQMKGYHALAKILLPDLPIVGVRINLHHILTDKSDFHRQAVTFTKQDMAEWVSNMNVWMRRIARDTETYNQLLATMQETGLSIWEIEDIAFPAHFGDNGCKRMYGYCQYFDVCSVSPKNRERVLAASFVEKPWNPLEMEDAD